MQELSTEINEYISEISKGRVPLTDAMLADIEYKIRKYRYDLNYCFYKSFGWQIRDYVHRTLDGYFNEEMNNCFKGCYCNIIRLNELQAKVEEQFKRLDK